ncbi:MAG: hypothetical protein HC767_03520 [Akkermansiaceae bacterium]|nr:hypothetical protein [Akkermansiaceae bacterium]
MQALGNVIRCPPSLLGFTLAAVNSLGDQATNLSVARSAGKRAAIAACFSSMTFNICIASAYGWVLYTRKEGGTVVPLQVSGPTWLLLCAVIVYLLGLLAVIFCGWKGSGAAYIPYQAGRTAQMAFMGLMVLFVCQAVYNWIR